MRRHVAFVFVARALWAVGVTQAQVSDPIPLVEKAMGATVHARGPADQPQSGRGALHHVEAERDHPMLVPDSAAAERPSLARE
jgi:hypothetical protein